MKSARHEKILELIRDYNIDTQEELASRLSEAGFNVTQATISRDIRALNMTKVTGRDGISRYAVIGVPEEGNGDRYARMMRESVISVEAAQNLVVLKTSPGMAMGIAAALDAMNWQEVLGCIAGDDTIMCAVHSEEESYAIRKRILAMIR